VQQLSSSGPQPTVRSWQLGGAPQAPALQAGHLDFLVNNAAVNIERSIEQTSDDHWDRHISVVLSAAFFTTRTALPLLADSRGCIVNIASELGLHDIANNVAYVSAKHGVLAMTRALAIELAPLNIRVNALCPGPVETPLLLRIFGDDPAAYERRRVHLPMGRLAKPREIVNAALFLASDESSYVNGATFLVDGGLTAAYVTPD
jgi:NAD(P)-dependent dehydrogenase (short-subunit alcohol dehydrogenase family)